MSFFDYTLYLQEPFFLYEYEAEQCPEFKNVLTINIPRLRKGEELLILDTTQDHGSEFSCRLATVHQCYIAFSVVHVQVCLTFFSISVLLYFFLAGQGSG